MSSERVTAVVGVLYALIGATVLAAKQTTSDRSSS
jgi:hypothetical protein